ncbi:MAG: zinc ribbon domain-containing protein [Anaerolineales bacterium]|jgi:hypothetical protein
MLKRFLALFLLLVCLAPRNVQAQGDLRLPSVEVDLWPEYDRPTVLVIYRLTLPASVSLPQELHIRIPTSAEINAVAVLQADGLFSIPYDRQVTGDYKEISFQATLPDVQIEYYDPGLVKEGSSRHFEYTWPGDYAVDSMEVQVQQPVDASDMRISPDLGSGVTAGDLTYYTAEVGSLEAGQTFSITFDYSKPNDTLSNSNLQIEASGPISDSSASGSLTTILPWVLGILGVVLIAGGGIWYWRSGREPAQPKRRTRRKTSAGPEAAPPVQEGGYIYCHQCGKRAAPGDRFCRTCGTQLRNG